MERDELYLACLLSSYFSVSRSHTLCNLLSSVNLASTATKMEICEVHAPLEAIIKEINIIAHHALLVGTAKTPSQPLCHAQTDGTHSKVPQYV